MRKGIIPLNVLILASLAAAVNESQRNFVIGTSVLLVLVVVALMVNFLDRRKSDTTTTPK